MTAGRTLRRYYVYSFLNGLKFTWTTWLAYVLAHNGNPGWAEAAFHFSILAGEVPTGVAADLFGRRTSIVVGLGLYTVTCASFLLVHDTLSACLLLGLCGLAGTFLSGADTALLYEAAEEAGGPELARKALARASALQLLGLSIAPAVAGFLYHRDDRLPFLAAAVVGALTLPVVWGMAERRPDAAPVHMGMWQQARAGAGVVLKSRAALALMLFGWGYNTVGAMAGQFGQVYFPYTGLTMAATGIVFSAARLSSTGAGAAAERLERRAAEGCLRFLPLFLCLAYLAMGVGGGWSGALLFVLGSALEGIIDPVLQFEINRAIPSAQRATVLSLLSAGFSGMMTVTFPAASYLRPVTRIYLVTGALGSMLAGIWAFRWRPGSGTGADRREPLPAREASGP